MAIECDKNGLDGMCHLGVRQLRYSLSNSVFCSRWMSQVQGFVFPKLLTNCSVTFFEEIEFCCLVEMLFTLN